MSKGRNAAETSAAPITFVVKVEVRRVFRELTESSLGKERPEMAALLIRQSRDLNSLVTRSAAAVMEAESSTSRCRGWMVEEGFGEGLLARMVAVASLMED